MSKKLKYELLINIKIYKYNNILLNNIKEKDIIKKISVNSQVNIRIGSR